MRILAAGLLALALSACVVLGPADPAPGKDVVLCHKGKKTMTLPAEAARAHLDHGDRYGPC